MKVLNPRVHGYIDYLLVLFLAVSPWLFHLGTSASTLAWVAAAGQLIYSLLTDYPLGAFRLIPMPIHGWIELAVGVVAIISPWLFRFADDPAGRWLFVLTGVAVVVVWALTDYSVAAAHREERGMRGASPPAV